METKVSNILKKTYSGGKMQFLRIFYTFQSQMPVGRFVRICRTACKKGQAKGAQTEENDYFCGVKQRQRGVRPAGA